MYEIIESMGYKTIKLTTADGAEWFIPFDEDNKMYQEYLKSLETNTGASQQV